MGERPRATPELDGVRRSREVEAGGVTCGANAHLTASLVMSTSWSRVKSNTALGIGRMHQESYVHDGPTLIDAREWSRKKSEGSAKRTLAALERAASRYKERARELYRIRYEQNREQLRAKAREYMRKRYARDREVFSRPPRLGTSEIGNGYSNMTASIALPTSIRFGRKNVSGAEQGTRPILPSGRPI
jgi:hypothetical protein